jgi:hypothetical protein
VERRVDACKVARRKEQLVRVIEVVAEPAEGARVRLPVLRNGLDVVEPRERPDVRAVVVVQRRLVP